jgi:hypothetical protein
VSDYLSQTELGKLFGATSHEIGKWLLDIGLRNEWKKPSKRAFDEGFVSTAGTNRGGTGGYFYVWSREKTVAALQSAGHRLKLHFDPNLDGRLKGPFEARRSSTHGYELADFNGHIAYWAMGKENAETLIELLNLAHKHGRFAGSKK